MSAAAIPRPEYARAIVLARVSAGARRVGLWISEHADWGTGVLARYLPGRVVACVLGISLRGARRVLRELRVGGWIEVWDRGPLGIPRYRLALPNRRPVARDVPGEEPEAELLWLDADQDAPPPAWDERPESRGVLGRMADVARAVVAGVAMSFVSPPDVAALPSQISYPGRRNVEPPPLDPVARAALRGRVVAPADPSMHADGDVVPIPGARHAGALYPTREAAAAAAPPPPRYDRPGDQSPHRRAWTAYRLAYRRDMGKDPPMSRREHGILAKMLDSRGVEEVERIMWARRWRGGV